jgi:lysophospholipase L1-like esterase
MGASIIQYWHLPLHNGGIGRQTTSEVLARFKSEVVGHGYERVIILCGTNDILQNTPNLVTEISANLKSMGEIATEAGLEFVLSELPPAVWAGMDLSSTISAVNAAIAQLAKEQGYLLVGYFSPMSGHPEFFLDGVHPSPAGYAAMEKALSAIVVRQGAKRHFNRDVYGSMKSKPLLVISDPILAGSAHSIDVSTLEA